MFIRWPFVWLSERQVDCALGLRATVWKQGPWNRSCNASLGQLGPQWGRVFFTYAPFVWGKYDLRANNKNNLNLRTSEWQTDGQGANEQRFLVWVSDGCWRYKSSMSCPWMYATALKWPCLVVLSFWCVCIRREEGLGELDRNEGCGASFWGRRAVLSPQSLFPVFADVKVQGVLRRKDPAVPTLLRLPHLLPSVAI